MERAVSPSQRDLIVNNKREMETKSTYESERNDLHRELAGFSYENMTPRQVRDLVKTALEFIVKYTKV